MKNTNRGRRAAGERPPLILEAPLNGRYIKKDNLGKGAFGSVISAFDLDTSKTVAIKSVLSKDSIEAFQEELFLLKRLKNPYLISYLDSYIDQRGNLQIVMDYAESGSIFNIIRQFGPLTESVASMYVAQLLTGLAYLHEQGVVHRDIKAANVLIHKGQAKLADFGLAVNIEEYGHTLRECAGSPYWMAPEVINSDPVTYKSDIWSVGITVVEFLKGYPPLFDLPPMPAMFQIAGPRDMPLPSGISPELRDFLSRCLQKRQSQRPSATELLNHPWLSAAREKVGGLKPLTLGFKDNRSFTMRLGSIASWSDSPTSSQNLQETVLNLSVRESYVESILKLGELFPTAKQLPQMLLNICGMRVFIDSLDDEGFRIPTTNFMIEMANRSERLADALVVAGMLRKLVFGDEHSVLTGFALMFGGKDTARFFCAAGLTRKLQSFASNSRLSIFVPRIIKTIFESSIPSYISSDLLCTKNIAKILAEMAFKATLHKSKYVETLESEYGILENVFSGGMTGKLGILKPCISKSMLEVAQNAAFDALDAIARIAASNPELMASEIGPVALMLSNTACREVIPSKVIKDILSIMISLSENSIARDSMSNDGFVKALLHFIREGDEGTAVLAMRVAGNLLRVSPALIEQTLGLGLCDVLEKGLEYPETVLRVRMLICTIPSVSAYAVAVMKSSNLYNHILHFLDMEVIDRKAVSAISWTAEHDRKFAEELISREGIKMKLERFLEAVMAYEEDPQEMSQIFGDYSRLFKKLPSLAEQMDLEKMYNIASKKLQISTDSTAGPILEFLMVLAKKSKLNSDVVMSLIPKLASLSQSPIPGIQKESLRLRVIAKR